MGPKLQVTKDYSIFEYHKFNRAIHHLGGGARR